ncbi:MAG: protein-disulfide reductase DsbD [Pseudomonadota bacterium]
MNPRQSLLSFPAVRWLLAWPLMLCLFMSCTASANGLLSSSKHEFLPVAQAFQTTASTQVDGMVLHFDIAAEHYLYARQFRLNWPKGLDDLPALPGFAAGELNSSWHDDPSFGRVQIYRDSLDWRFKLPMLNADQQARFQKAGAVVNVRYQGCADAGLCYPPQQWQVAAATTDGSAEKAPENAAPVLNAEDANSIATWLAQANFWAILAAFFALGLGLAFTPCVLPMLPILSAIIAGQNGKAASARRGFVLALSYVLGMALMYSLAGLLIARFGAAANISAWMQQPAVLIPFALIFVILAGVLWQGRDLSLPEFMQAPLQRWQAQQQGGAYGSVFVMGAISSLVVSPCVSAPLAGVLLFISTTQDAVLGGSALFALGMGMGVPLLLLGIGGGRWLPRSGPWLDASKRVFAAMLFAIAIVLLNRLLPILAQLLLWAGFFTIAGSWLVTRAPASAKMAGMLCLAWAMFVVFAAARGGDSAWTPWTALTEKTSAVSKSASSASGFTRISDPAAVDAAIAQAAREQRPVIVDVFADWCVSCVEMEHKVLVLPATQALLAPGLRIKFDITDTTEAQLAWMQREKLIGPPAFLFWNAKGQQQPGLIGESSKETFESSVKKAWN